MLEFRLRDATPADLAHTVHLVRLYSLTFLRSVATLYRPIRGPGLSSRNGLGEAWG
jgi:hypothetical protein